MGHMLAIGSETLCACKLGASQSFILSLKQNSNMSFSGTGSATPFESVMADLDTEKEHMPDRTYLKMCNSLKRAWEASEESKAASFRECMVLKLAQRIKHDGNALECVVSSTESRMWLKLDDVADVEHNLSTRGYYYYPEPDESTILGCDSCSAQLSMSSRLCIVKLY